MGTRSILEFIEGTNKIQVYRHWDGYVKGVLPDLEAFLKWNGSRSNDLSYTVANFILWSKLNGIIRNCEYAKKQSKTDKYWADQPKSVEEMFSKADSNDNLHTGFGIMDKLANETEFIDYGAEYFYRISLNEGNHQIKCYVVGQSGIEYIGDTWYDVEQKSLSHTDKRLEKELAA